MIRIFRNNEDPSTSQGNVPLPAYDKKNLIEIVAQAQSPDPEVKMNAVIFYFTFTYITFMHLNRYFCK